MLPDDLLPGKPLSQPPIPRVIHRMLQKYRFETEYDMRTWISGMLYTQCTEEFHEYVRRLEDYFRVVDPTTSMKRLDKIIRELIE